MPPSTRILIAEDDSSIREFLRARLRLAGYETRAVHNGLYALAEIRSWRPDAMLLDINMPVFDGFGVLKAMAAEPMLGPRTLVLTARHAAADVELAIRLGAKDYLSKPFSEGQLLARVARLVRKTNPVGGDSMLL